MGYRKFRADYLFNGNCFLGNDTVLVTNKEGIIKDILPIDAAGEDVEFIHGILSPGFINCHCHLELSHMKGIVPEQTGLVGFILYILQQRHATESEILEAIQAAETEMIQNGIVAVGDISNNALSLIQKMKQNIQYHNFIEVSGFNPAFAKQRFEAAETVFDSFISHFPTQTSLVPHAPYSVSEELFQLINERNNHQLLSIHNQETLDENEFFQSGKGDFNNLYQTLGIDISSFFKPSGKNSLQSVLPYINNPKQIMLVHNTFICQQDIDFLTSLSPTQQFVFCICPNANLYIETRLPPIELLVKNDCCIVLGTDSLASNHSLSILSEIQTIIKNFPAIPTEILLQWATINGAKALKMDESIGSFEVGKKPGIICISNLTENGSISPNSKVEVVL